MQIDGSDVSVQADPAQLTLVLRNLILNSAQAIDGRGEIRLGTRSGRRVDGPSCARLRPGHPARSAGSGVRAVLYDETSRARALAFRPRAASSKATAARLTLEFPVTGGTVAVMRLRTADPPPATSASTAPVGREVPGHAVAARA